MPQPTLLDRLGYASEAEYRAALRVGGPTGPVAPPPPPATPALPPRHTEAEAAPWRALARACPWRVPLDGALRLAYQGCQCKEPADCLLGKATVRPWVGLDTECRACVEAGGPPPPPPVSDSASGS